MYDVTNRSSFDALSDWLIEIRNNLPQPSDMDSVVFIVCANKVWLANSLSIKGNHVLKPMHVWGRC